MRRLTVFEVAAYLLDRADQYETDSPCWVALADAAHEMANGQAVARVDHGELDDADLRDRVRLLHSKPGMRPVDPRLGTDPTENP